MSFRSSYRESVLLYILGVRVSVSVGVEESGSLVSERFFFWFGAMAPFLIDEAISLGLAPPPNMIAICGP